MISVICLSVCLYLGLDVVSGECSFFHKNERYYQERSHSSEKKAQNAFLKILKQLVKEGNGTEIAWKEHQNQERVRIIKKHVLSQKHILNQECVLNHLEIILKNLIRSPDPPPPCIYAPSPASLCHEGGES